MTTKPLPLKVHLARRARRRWALAACVVAVLALLSWADHHGMLLYGSDYTRYHCKSFTVVRVVDGDTIEIDAADGTKATTRVVLWGIDTPELSSGPFGEAAKDAVTTWCKGAKVTLLLEPHRLRDYYDRLLAHVQLPDGSLLNERLLSAGLARSDDRWPHDKMERYALLEHQARFDRAGLWAK